MGPSVAFDTGSLIGPRSGVGLATEHLLRSLLALEPGPEIRPYVLSFRAPLEPGTTRLAIPAALAHRMWSRCSFPTVDRALGHPDVIHGTNYVVPPARAARLVTVYDCWFLRHPDTVHRDVARAGRVLRRSVADGATVHTSSRATAAEIADLLDARRIEVIPPGAIPPPPVPVTAPHSVAALAGRPFVLALGTVERRKNLKVLVEAFAAAAVADPDLVLVIAGAPGNDSPAVDAAIAAANPSARRRITALGRVDDDAKGWLLGHARALAYPSLDEGFGFPILEAMQSELPVVASTAGSIPEVAGGAATLVDPTDVAAMADALLAVHLDEAVRRTMIEAGRRRVHDFAWPTTARRMNALYAELAMEPRR